jgi:hypothetical protein
MLSRRRASSRDAKQWAPGKIRRKIGLSLDYVWSARCISIVWYRLRPGNNNEETAVVGAEQPHPRIVYPQLPESLTEGDLLRWFALTSEKRARGIACEAIAAAAQSRIDPADLINAAIDSLIRESCELPQFDAAYYGGPGSSARQRDPVARSL